MVWEYTNYAGDNPRTGKFGSEWVNVIQMGSFKMTVVIESNSYYLYNLNIDPNETKDVLNEYLKFVEKLKQRLEVWKRETGYEQPGKNPDYKK